MRKLAILAVMAAVVVAVLALGQGRPATANSNLVVNGSFETPATNGFDCGYPNDSPPGWMLCDSSQVPGWTVEWNQAGNPPGLLELQRGVVVPATDGFQIVELDTHTGPNSNSNVRIYQNLATCPGAQYTVQYDWRDRTGLNSVDVSWDGNVLATHTGTQAWTPAVHTWTASGATTQIMFADTVVDGSGRSDNLGTLLDAVSVEEVPLTCAIPVDIDIKPGSDPNCFNNDGHGVIPVAILGSATFDVNDIDPVTVELAGLTVRVKGKSNKLLAHIEDVNGDGFDDLVVQIEDTDGTFLSGSGTAAVTGFLFDGTPFEGTDAICVVQ